MERRIVFIKQTLGIRALADGWVDEASLDLTDRFQVDAILMSQALFDEPCNVFRVH